MVMNVLVTGSRGFLGLAVVSVLEEAGHRVIHFDVVDGSEFDITRVEVLDDPLWGEADGCIHLAAMADITTTETHRGSTFDVNVLGTFHVAEACRIHGIPLVYASTCCVYGYNSVKPWTEESEPMPPEFYARTKLFGEEVVRHTALEWCILRLGTLVGANQRGTLATSVFLKQARAGKTFTINGDGAQRRNWVDVADAARAFLAAIEHPVSCGETFNVAGACTHSVLELASICQEVVSPGVPPRFMHRPPRGGDFDEEISSEKIRGMLGWVPITSLAESLRRA